MVNVCFGFIDGLDVSDDVDVCFFCSSKLNVMGLFKWVLNSLLIKSLYNGSSSFSLKNLKSCLSLIWIIESSILIMLDPRKIAYNAWCSFFTRSITFIQHSLILLGVLFDSDSMVWFFMTFISGFDVFFVIFWYI